MVQAQPGREAQHEFGCGVRGAARPFLKVNLNNPVPGTYPDEVVADRLNGHGCCVILKKARGALVPACEVISLPSPMCSTGMGAQVIKSSLVSTMYCRPASP